MCGLLGSVNLPFDQAVLDMIAHRGPDAGGLVQYGVGRHTVTLGHRRLSILDLSSAGAQPMETFCKRYSIVYNGEIYNHSALRKAQTDIHYQGHSDTETILNAIAQCGVDVVREFNGIFALAFADLENNKLYLVRDQFGVKPLYYRLAGNRLVFGSEIKPLLLLIPDNVDQDHLAEVLLLRYSPSPDTLFKNVRKVRPGHIVEVDLAAPNLKVKEYPYLGQCPDQTGLSFESAVEQYEELYTNAAERQLMSDVEVGILLSGGIDSALVASNAQRRSSYRMKAFTVGFDQPGYVDEISDAADTAKLIGLEHHCTRITFHDFFELIRKCISIVEEPLATTSIIPMYYLSSLAAKHVKVVLSGQGADEPLGGYGRYQSEIYQRYIPASLARLVNHLVKGAGIKCEQYLRGLYALSEPKEIDRFIRTYSVFSEKDIEKLVGRSSPSIVKKLAYLRDVLACQKQKTSVERMMSLDLRMNLSDDLLLYTDKITMHHSLECRVPMLDLDLVRFIESLPRHYRVKLGNGKRIHKAYARKILPLQMVNRAKKGFFSPTREWFMNGGLLEDILYQSGSRFSRYFDLKMVGEVLNQHQSGFNRERHIFLLLALFYWCEEFA